jgi:hypothetical protein
MDVRTMLYYGLVYPLLAYGILWGQSAKAFTRFIIALQKMAVKFKVGLRQWEPHR